MSEGIARLLDLASKPGRLASGMATDRAEVTGQVETKLEVEWELALRKMYGGEARVAGEEPEAGQIVDVGAERVLPAKEVAGVDVSPT